MAEALTAVTQTWAYVGKSAVTFGAAFSLLGMVVLIYRDTRTIFWRHRLLALFCLVLFIVDVWLVWWWL